MNERHAQKMRGFTLTELAIVLGVMGTILSAIWVASARVNASKNAQKANEQVQMILSGYRNLFANRRVDTAPSFGDITTIGINAGYFPSDMISGAIVNGPWSNSTVSVRGDSGWNGIVISYWHVPKYGCIALATSQANVPDLLQSYLGPNGTGPNNVIYPPNGAGAADGSPPLYSMTSTDINADCAQGGNDNEVTFEYKAQ